MEHQAEVVTSDGRCRCGARLVELDGELLHITDYLDERMTCGDCGRRLVRNHRGIARCPWCGNT